MVTCLSTSSRTLPTMHSTCLSADVYQGLNSYIYIWVASTRGKQYNKEIYGPLASWEDRARARSFGCSEENMADVPVAPLPPSLTRRTASSSGIALNSTSERIKDVTEQCRTIVSSAGKRNPNTKWLLQNVHIPSRLQGDRPV